MASVWLHHDRDSSRLKSTTHWIVCNLWQLTDSKTFLQWLCNQLTGIKTTLWVESCRKTWQILRRVDYKRERMMIKTCELSCLSAECTTDSRWALPSLSLWKNSHSISSSHQLAAWSGSGCTCSAFKTRAKQLLVNENITILQFQCVLSILSGVLLSSERVLRIRSAHFFISIFFFAV